MPALLPPGGRRTRAEPYSWAIPVTSAAEGSALGVDRLLLVFELALERLARVRVVAVGLLDLLLLLVDLLPSCLQVGARRRRRRCRWRLGGRRLGRCRRGRRGGGAPGRLGGRARGGCACRRGRCACRRGGPDLLGESVGCGFAGAEAVGNAPTTTATNVARPISAHSTGFCDGLLPAARSRGGDTTVAAVASGSSSADSPSQPATVVGTVSTLARLAVVEAPRRSATSRRRGACPAHAWSWPTGAGPSAGAPPAASWDRGPVGRPALPGACP